MTTVEFALIAIPLVLTAAALIVGAFSRMPINELAGFTAIPAAFALVLWDLAELRAGIAGWITRAFEHNPGSFVVIGMVYLVGLSMLAVPALLAGLAALHNSREERKPRARLRLVTEQPERTAMTPWWARRLSRGGQVIAIFCGAAVLVSIPHLHALATQVYEPRAQHQEQDAELFDSGDGDGTRRFRMGDRPAGAV